MDKRLQEKILKDTQKSYDLIAPDYARTRLNLSTYLKEAIAELNPSGKILDSGCGSGAVFEALISYGIDYYGLDFSKKLIELATEKYPQGRFFEGDVLRLPFEDNYFDSLLSISVAHHIPGNDLRSRFIKEQMRVVKPNGKMLFRVWDLKIIPEAASILAKNTFWKFLGQNKMDFGDIMYPWKSSEQKIVAYRYFHCFTENELANLLKKSGLEVIKVWKEGKPPTAMSIFALAKKK